MNPKLKLLLGALAALFIFVFALLGLLKTFTADEANPQLADDNWQPPLITNANIPSVGTLPPNSPLTRPLNDKPPGAESSQIELVGEEPPATPPVRPSPAAQPPVQPTTPATPAPAMPPAAPATTTLEVIATNEEGKALNANIYIQQTNGNNVDKASETAQASFELKPGTYKVTARAAGYGSVSRTIKLTGGASLSEVLVLPRAAAPAASNPPPRPPETVTAPVSRQPEPAPTRRTEPANATPLPPERPAAAGNGQLRLVAVAASDGRPLPVDFTISRLDGKVVEQVNGAPMAELTLPAQEFVVSFHYQGVQGYKSLHVKPGQTIEHVFNIREEAPAREQPPLLPPPDFGQPMAEAPPASTEPPAQGQPSLEETLMRMLQDEVNKHLNR